jgi:protein-tyrosine phosphatase
VHLNVDNVEQVRRSPASYTINGTQYLLVELPNVHVGRHVEAVLKHLIGEGISPIIAHPERNPVLQKNLPLLEGWVEFGCLLQLTALSVTGGFGGRAKAASTWLLQRGLAHVVASDSHDPVRRHPRLKEAYAEVSSRYGTDYADALFRDNPRDIVDGVSVARGPQIFEDSSPRWWQFWQHT